MSYFKWSEQTTNKLIELRRQGVGYRACADEIGCTYDAAKQRGSQLIRSGVLIKTPVNERAKSPTAPNFTVQDLNQYVLNDSRKDAHPRNISYAVIKHYGTWSAALEANGLEPNIGGKFCKHKPMTLYLLKFDGFYKVGVTQQVISQRFSGAPAYIVLDQYCGSSDEVLEFEKLILQKIKPHQFVPSDPWFERNGKTECFRADYTVEKQRGQEIILADLL